MKIDVYRNLNNGLLSVVYKGKVVGHCDMIRLAHAGLRVSEAGRRRVIMEMRKNVHAFVSGDPISVRGFRPYKGRSLKIHRQAELASAQMAVLMGSKTDSRNVTYNPYKHDSFVDKATGEPVHHADVVDVRSDGSITAMYVGCPDAFSELAKGIDYSVNLKPQSEPQTTEPAPDVQEFELLCKSLDRYYHMSDDPLVYRDNHTIYHQINATLKQVRAKHPEVAPAFEQIASQTFRSYA